MKANLLIYIYIVMLGSTCFYSCMDGVQQLDKKDADKQITYFMDTSFAPLYHTSKYLDSQKTPANMLALKEQGFIDLVPTNDGKLEIVVLDKGKPYFVSEAYDEFQFSPGAYNIEILSVDQPENNKQGEAKCYVAYREKVVQTPFLKAWNPHCMREDGVYNETAVFVKKKNGWQIETAWL